MVWEISSSVPTSSSNEFIVFLVMTQLKAIIRIFTLPGDVNNFSPKYLFNVSNSLTQTFHHLVNASFTDFDNKTI